MKAALAKHALDAKAVQHIAKEWYDKNGPFAGAYKMATPLRRACCNAADGRTWSVLYKVIPDTEQEYWAQFAFEPKLGKRGVGWEVADCNLEEGAGSEEHLELRLNHSSAAAVAKAWYDNESPYAGDYAMVAPVLGAYCNTPDGRTWSIKYRTQPDAGGEVFVQFEFGVKPLKQRGAGVAWEVVRMGENDPSEKDLARKRPKASRKSGGGAAANKRRRSNGAADDGASQKRSRPASSASRRTGAAAAVEGEDDSAQHQIDDEEQGHGEDPEDDALYLSLDNEQPQQIAVKLGIELAMLLELNKPKYKGLTARAKLQPGTQLLLPPRGAGWYEALNDETPKLIAEKLKLDGGADALVVLNKPMYKRLSPGSKLQAGTKLLLPGDGCGWHYLVEAADGSVASIAKKLKVDDVGNFVAINAGIFGHELVAETELPEGTKLLVPAGTDSHFLSKYASAVQQQRARGTKELAAAKAESEAAEVITRITPPKRTKLKSEEHEKMHKIWDALCSVGDGFGRSRSESFMTLPKKTNSDYYETIDDPISLGLIRKRIINSASSTAGKGHGSQAKGGGWQGGTSLSYSDMDEFEAAMTLLFENARLYYKDVDEVAYADAEVLQDIFWQAFQAAEAGVNYKVEPTGKKISDDGGSSSGVGQRRSRAAADLMSEDEEDREEAAMVASQGSGGRSDKLPSRKRAKGGRSKEYEGETDEDEALHESDDNDEQQQQQHDQEDSDSDGSFDEAPTAAITDNQKGGKRKGSSASGDRGPWQLKMNEQDWYFVEHHFESFPAAEVEKTLDRQHLPRCAVGDVVSIYSLLRNLQSELGLGVFQLDELFCALAAPNGEQNRLLTDVHVMLLRALNMPQVNSAMADRTGESDHYLLYWLSINAHNWPELLRRYAELYVSQPLDPTAADRGFDPLVPQARCAVKVLATQEYWLLPPAAKVEILRFLTEALYCRGEETSENGIQPYLQQRLEQVERRGAESAQGSPDGANDDDYKGVNCATCGDGGELICCDLCCCSYHSDGCALMPDGSPMEEMPPEDEKWYCGFCASKDHCSVNVAPLGCHEVVDESLTAVQAEAEAAATVTVLTRFWFAGGHIFGEDVATGTFVPWSKVEVQTLLKRTEGTDGMESDAASAVSDELRAGLEHWMPVIRDTPIPHELCDVFRPSSVTVAATRATKMVGGDCSAAEGVAKSTHDKSSSVDGVETLSPPSLQSSGSPAPRLQEEEFHGAFINKNASSRYLRPVATVGYDVYWDHRTGGWWYYNSLSQSSSWEEPNVPPVASAPSPEHNHGLVFDPRKYSQHFTENAAVDNPSIMMATPSAGPDVGGSIHYYKDEYWGMHEMLHLLMLVRRDGIGDWGLKAKLLGGRRSADAVRRWYTTNHSAVSIVPHHLDSIRHVFQVFDRKWPAQPYGEAVRGTISGGEVSMCSLEHVKSSMFALESMIPPQCMTRRWSYGGLRDSWMISLHCATTGRDLAELLEQLEMEMDDHLMVIPWHSTTGWVTDFDQQDNISIWKDTNLKRKRKQYTTTLTIERLSAIPDKIAAMRASKKSREAAQLASATQVDAANIVSGRRRRSTHNYAEENTAGWDGSARRGAGGAVEGRGRGRGRGRGGGRPKGKPKGKPKGRPKGVSAEGTEAKKEQAQSAANAGSSAPAVAPSSVSGIVQLAFDQEIALRSMNAMTEVDICSTLDTTFIDVLHTARKDPADVVPPHRRKRGSARRPYPVEWGDLPSHGPYRAQRWDIREQSSEVDRIVYREISKSRVRKLARSAGLLQMSGFQYFLPTMDSMDHPHYGRSYGEILKDKNPETAEERKHLDTPPMLNLHGAWRIQVRKAQTIAAVDLQLSCLASAIDYGELCTVDLCDRPLVPPLENDAALRKSWKRGSPAEWQADPEREGWMDLAVRSMLDSIVTALELRELEAAARKRSAANAATVEAIEAEKPAKKVKEEEADSAVKDAAATIAVKNTEQSENLDGGAAIEQDASDATTSTDDNPSAVAASTTASGAEKSSKSPEPTQPPKQPLSQKILLQQPKEAEDEGSSSAAPAQHMGGIVGVHHPVDTEEVQARRKANDMLRNFDRIRSGREQNQRERLQFVLPDEQEEQPKPWEDDAATAAVAAAASAAAAAAAAASVEAAEQATSFPSLLARQDNKPKAENSETFRANWNNEERRLFELAMQMYGAKNFDAIAKGVGTRNPEQIRTYSIRRRKRFLRKGLNPEVAHIHLYDTPTNGAATQPSAQASEGTDVVEPSESASDVAPGQSGEAAPSVVDSSVTITAANASPSAAVGAERNKDGRDQDGCGGQVDLHGPTAPLKNDAELYRTMQIEVPDIAATTMLESEAHKAQPGQKDSATNNQSEGDGKADEQEGIASSQKIAKFCKLTLGGIEHFVTIPPGLAPGESYTRSLPKAYDSVTLRTLDTSELRMWLQHRGVRQAAAATTDEQAPEQSAATEWKTMYDACLQYIMLKRNDRPVSCAAVEGWEPKWSPTHERYFWWHSATKQSQWEDPATSTQSDKIRRSEEEQDMVGDKVAVKAVAEVKVEAVSTTANVTASSPLATADTEQKAPAVKQAAAASSADAGEQEPDAAVKQEQQ